MPTLPTSELPRPKSWDEFEEIVWDIFTRKWHDPHAQRYGRTGQEQQGVDVYGQPAELKGGYAGVQCKRYEDAQFNWKVIQAEIIKAENFKPPLGQFILATTASRDARLQEKVREINLERAQAGKFQIELYFWEDLSHELCLEANHDLLKLHYPGWMEVFGGEREYRLSSLHTLPAPPADFTGRETELEKLLASQERSASISGVHGLGGIGKTALALVLADRLKAHYPDAQLLIEMRGTDPQPMPPAEAMVQVIRAWHPDARLPEDERQLQDIYLSVLSDKKALLLLDNARGKAQVEPLLPPRSCCLLVTSRWKFTLPGLQALNLEALPEGEAIQLLLSIAPRLDCQALDADGKPGQACSLLAKICEYIPLALRLTAGALCESTQPVTEFLASFADARQRLALTGMDACLRFSYERLEADLSQKLRVLAVFPAPFDRAAAAAVWELEEEQSAQGTLDALRRASLLDFDAESGRFHLHDLVRDFLAGLLSPQEQWQAERHHAVHYYQVAREANALYMQGGEHVLEGLRLFDDEWKHIQAGQRWSVAQAGKGETLDRLCAMYPNAAAYIFHLRLHPQEYIHWLEPALEAARRAGMKDYQGYHLGNLGLRYTALGQYQKAIEYHHQHLVIAREIGDRGGEGAALGNLGIAYNSLGQYLQAIDFYQKALVIEREIGNRGGEANSLGNLGVAYDSLGQYNTAIKCHQQALAIAREIGDRQWEGGVLGNLGLTYDSLGQYQQAIDFYQQQLVIAGEIGDRRGEGNALGNLGNAYQSLGQYEQTIQHHQQALAIDREIGDKRGESQDLGNLGNAYQSLGQYEQAIQHHQGQLEIARQIGDRQGEAKCLGNLGNAYHSLGQYDTAIKYHQQALTIAREIGDRQGEAKSLGNLGNAYHSLGQYDTVINYHQQALTIAREIGDRQWEGGVLANLGVVYATQGDLPRARQHWQQALAVYEQLGVPEAEKVRGWLEE